MKNSKENLSTGEKSKEIKDSFELNRNTDINDKEGNTLLHEAARNGCKTFIEHAIDEGANINITDSDGLTPFHVAITHDFDQIAKIFVEDNSKVTTLHTASKRGFPQIIRLILDKEMDINTLDEHRNTPLHYASQNNNQRIMELLIKKGADITIKNTSGETPQDIGDRIKAESRSSSSISDNTFEALKQKMPKNTRNI